jgi:hypothetical protein
MRATDVSGQAGDRVEPDAPYRYRVVDALFLKVSHVQRHPAEAGRCQVARERRGDRCGDRDDLPSRDAFEGDELDVADAALRHHGGLQLLEEFVVLVDRGLRRRAEGGHLEAWESGTDEARAEHVDRRGDRSFGPDGDGE